MDLNSAVEFGPLGNADASEDIRKIVDEYRLKSEEMGFYDQRMTYGNYNENMEDELKAAYDETTRLEGDIRQLVTLADVLVEQVGEYEQRIADMRNEKDHVFAETDYMQENMDALMDREKDKDDKILQLENEIATRDRTIKKLNANLQTVHSKLEAVEEELEEKKEECFKKNETLVDRETESDDKVRSLQDLIEYKDEHINELQESLDKMDERLEQIEKERDTLERNKEELQKTIAETKDNMAHYRNSCQSLSRDLKAANESLMEIQNRYEVLQRKENENMVKRMDSGSSLESMDGQFEYDQDKQQIVTANTGENEEDMLADTLGDELNELEGMEGFDEGNDGIIEGDFEGDYEQDDHTGIHEQQDDDFNQIDQNENEPYEQEQPSQEQEESHQNDQSMEQIEVHDVDMQTDLLPGANRKIQTDNKNKELLETEMQTDDLVKEVFSVNIQTEEFRKLHCSVKIQTTTTKMKSKSLDTNDLPVEIKPKVHFEEPQNIDTTTSEVNEVTSEENGATPNRRKTLILDNISSPSDSGSQKHAASSQNILGSNTSATSNGSGGAFNKKDLNYMLNRDPLKEFFHLTLQSVRMNSPHMNQILNVDCDQFYKKASDMHVPFNQWARWIEDQLNRIVLSRILKVSMHNKIRSNNQVPNITVSKVEDDVDKMDSKEVAKMLAKKAPATSRSTDKKGFFSFGFMKMKKDKETKSKVQEEDKKEKVKSIFDEILEKPTNIPKTSRNGEKKKFTFFEEGKEE